MTNKITRAEQILNLLKSGRKTSMEIRESIGLSKRSLERHMRTLRQKNAIYTIQLGRWIGYELRD